MYIIKRTQDKTVQKTAVEDAISLLTAEILRLAKLPYRSWTNNEKIRSLDNQILYLEELLAAYEKDNKKIV